MIIFYFFFSLFFGIKTLFVLRFFFILDFFTIFVFSLCFLVCYIIFYLFSENFYSLFFSYKDYFFYFFSFFIVVFFFLLTILSYSPLNFLLFMEISVLPMFFLMLNYSKDQDKIFSAILIIFFNVFSSAPFIYFSLFFSLSYFCCFRQLDFSLIHFDIDFLFFCCCLILLMKLPLFLFHFWLTKAHVRAFGCCSMILASIMLKIGSFGFVKFF